MEDVKALTEAYREYVPKLWNRRCFQPEFDMVSVCEGPTHYCSAKGLLVTVSIIETLMRPMTFRLVWRIEEHQMPGPGTGPMVTYHAAEPVDTDTWSGPSGHARNMHAAYGEPLHKWLELKDKAATVDPAVVEPAEPVAALSV